MASGAEHGSSGGASTGASGGVADGMVCRLEVPEMTAALGMTGPMNRAPCGDLLAPVAPSLVVGRSRSRR